MILRPGEGCCWYRPRVEIQQVKLFLAVAEHRGVNAAAAAEQVSQPTVSQTIRRLERELDVRLFHRIGSGMELTSGGHAFLGPARRIVRAALRAEASVGGDRLLGRLEMLVSPGLAVGPLSSLIAQFNLHWPQVDIRLTTFDPGRSVASALRDSSCEMVVCHLPQPSSRGFEVIELGTHEPWVLFPPGTVVGDGPVSSPDLAEVPLVVSKGGPEVSSIRAAVAAGGVPPRPVVIVEQREARFAMVAAGIGCTFVEKTLAHETFVSNAVARPLDPTIELPFGLVINPEMLSPAGRAFVEMVREEVGSRPY